MGDPTATGSANVVAVHSSGLHSFSKYTEPAIRLVAGWGVKGDAHAGTTVKHRSRVARNPAAPNLRQVHLIHAELFDELIELGFAVWPGDLGENITVRGLDLLGLVRGTRLRVGAESVIEVTGLRNPCSQIDRFQSGLLAATLGRDDAGRLVRKAGVMGIVLAGGEVRAGDAIGVELPEGPRRALEPV
ncbi:MAG: MOSC domain-containing protein [Gammaproteobacteria bacterium]|nr:MOSC domain-containing protein [Gammaproteobacteria bacterium]MBU1442284.1 MOSC domain-containing protein [Gammaproteobacteria bacterium]MBU2285593.1 MOSC domain-containing protein [Gammaproteobacteria bacterium]MBU2407265.1 MOSC domain-containing protein [Gammaproteobacteria bacterium]